MTASTTYMTRNATASTTTDAESRCKMRENPIASDVAPSSSLGLAKTPSFQRGQRHTAAVTVHVVTASLTVEVAPNTAHSKRGEHHDAARADLGEDMPKMDAHVQTPNSHVIQSGDVGVGVGGRAASFFSTSSRHMRLPCAATARSTKAKQVLATSCLLERHPMMSVSGQTALPTSLHQNETAMAATPPAVGRTD
ncbi:hypothetical protein E2562_026493 [Oryza meyeriana var. granulata]|uniref:Uncharacterized protein n=1 Tax=Oryza meyeriana var. granulata TaxID=110450 RepID=A0A6G1DQZ0_9ORYZ|nr:hypothetical protein E2562_026493 [Oryza meyeriana var. granulata]